MVIMPKRKNQMKLCECGCGESAPIAVNNNTKLGRIKGKPQRFIKGHQQRKPLGEGVHTTITGRNDRVSRVLAEKAIGKPLPEKVQVHHFSEDPRDNRNENLVVCENQAYHILLHRRKRAHEASGRAHWRRCVFCKEWDDPKNLYINKGKVYHRTCRNKRLREQRREKQKHSGSIATHLLT